MSEATVPTTEAVPADQGRMPHARTASSLAVTYRVWQRHWDAFLRIWKTEVPGVLGEPFFALAAFGTGLGFYVQAIGDVEYGQFVAPGLVAGYAMFGATFETTFGAYLRMMSHRTFESILATPVTVRELVLGEMAWGATRAVLSGGAMLLIAALFGFVREPTAVLVLPLAFLVGLVFAAISLSVTALVPAMSTSNTYFTLFIAPMFFLSGTFFPIDNLPAFFRAYAMVLPLTYGSDLIRGASIGEFDVGMVLSAVVLLAMLAVFAPLSIWLMRRRLVK